MECCLNFVWIFEILKNSPSLTGKYFLEKQFYLISCFLRVLCYFQHLYIFRKKKHFMGVETILSHFMFSSRFMLHVFPTFLENKVALLYVCIYGTHPVDMLAAISLRHNNYIIFTFSLSVGKDWFTFSPLSSYQNIFDGSQTWLYNRTLYLMLKIF